MAKGGRAQSDTPGRSPWPLSAWPSIPTRFVLCTENRPATVVAKEVLHRVGWLPPRAAGQ